MNKLSKSGVLYLFFGFSIISAAAMNNNNDAQVLEGSKKKQAPKVLRGEALLSALWQKAFARLEDLYSTQRIRNREAQEKEERELSQQGADAQALEQLKKKWNEKKVDLARRYNAGVDEARRTYVLPWKEGRDVQIKHFETEYDHLRMNRPNRSNRS